MKNKGKKRIRGYCIDCNTEITGQYSKRCRPCNSKFKFPDRLNQRKRKRFWLIKKKYNITEEQYNTLLNYNNKQCYICNRDLEEPKSQQGQGQSSICIDHCHKTNTIRGILCKACNTAIGLFNDDINILKSAIGYLSKYEKISISTNS